MENVITYLRQQRPQHLAELFELLRMPTVSTLPEHAADVRRCAEWLQAHVTRLGLRHAQLFETAGHPLVYADWLDAPDAPTILIYGHYDVQPPDPLDLWQSPPFAPEIRDGEIYARGAADDKGQFWAYLKAIEAFFTQTGKLPVNVKLLLEGEEEIGSENMHEFVVNHADLLRADAILLSDNSQQARGVPTICYGSRGLAHCQVEITTAARDLHSGGFGGLAANPILVLAKMLAALKDQDQRVTIPGFYDDVVGISAAERRNFERLPFEAAAVKQEVGLRELVGETGFTPLECNWARPTLEINGIWGGFTGAGLKTIIPAQATAKITMRLVPQQDPAKIYQAAKAYIEQLTPASATLRLTGGPDGRAYLTPLDHPIFQPIVNALRQTYDVEPVFNRTGGTISVLSTFEDVLRIPIALIGLSNPDDNIHAPNEHLCENAFYLGIEAIARVLAELRAWRP